MFETLMARGARVAERLAADRAQWIAGRLADALPGDVRIATDGSGVRLSGRALERRLARDPALRWAIAGLIR